MAILFDNAHLLDGIAEAAGVMLLKETFFCSPLGTTNQTDRTVAAPRQHDRCDRFIIITQLAFAELSLGKDDPPPVTYLDAAGRLGARYGDNRGNCFKNDRFGFFVFTQPQITRMAQHAFSGEFNKGDLCDKLGLYPMCASNGGARRVDRSGLLFQRCHNRRQSLDFVAREAGANFADVTQLSLLVHAEQERAKAALLVRRDPTDDDELLPAGAFRLDPCSPARRGIFGINPLGDHPLKASTANAVEQLIAVAYNMVRIAQPLGLYPENMRKFRFAFDQRQSCQIFAVQLEQIEREIVDLCRITFECCL